jgi:hypothetical protein
MDELDHPTTVNPNALLLLGPQHLRKGKQKCSCTYYTPTTACATHDEGPSAGKNGNFSRARI